MPSVDEDLKAFLSSGSAPAQASQTSDVDSDLASFLKNGQQANSDRPSGLSGIESTVKQSPLSASERFVLGFTDDVGKEDYLKKKFKIVLKDNNGRLIAGDSEADLAPYDSSQFEPMKDLADLASGTPSFVGFAVGAAMGGPGGAALGTGIGRSAEIGIGKSMGVDKHSMGGAALDVGASAVFAGVFEGASRVIGKYVSNQITKKAFDRQTKELLDLGVANSKEPQKFVGGLAKVFKVTSAVDEKDTLEAGLYGFNQTLAAPYTNPEHLTKITDQFIKRTIDREAELGSAVREGAEWGIANFGKKSVDTKTPGTQLLSELAKPEYGIIDAATGNVNKFSFSDPRDMKAIKNTLRIFFKENETGALIPKEMNFAEALNARKAFDRTSKQYMASPTANKATSRLIKMYSSAIRENLVGATIPEGMARSEAEGMLLSNNPFYRANKQYSQWRKSMEILSKNGLDVEETSALKAMEVSGRYLSSQVEKFAGSLQNKTSSAKEAFSLVAEQLGRSPEWKAIGGGPGTLVDELRKFSAAQGFAKSDLNLLRFNAVVGRLAVGSAVGGSLGYLLDKNSPVGAIGGLGAGLLFATPFGASLLLRHGEKLFKSSTFFNDTVKSIAQKYGIKAIPDSAKKVGGATGRAVLQKLVTERQKEKSNDKKDNQNR